MGDLIERRAAIEVALDAIYYDEYWTEQVEKAINALPSAQPEPQWIPVSKRLPERGALVLATTAWDDITMAEWLGGNEWFIHEGASNAETEDIKAWKPLPKPWKGEKNE